MAKPRPFYGELSSASDVSLPDWLQPIGRVVVTGKAEHMEWKTTRHMRRLFVYYLEHSCQCHLIMANVRAAPNKKLFSTIKEHVVESP